MSDARRFTSRWSTRPFSTLVCQDNTKTVHIYPTRRYSTESGVSWDLILLQTWLCRVANLRLPPRD